MANKPMGFLNIGSNNYEIVDITGRQATQELALTVSQLSASNLPYDNNTSTKEKVDAVNSNVNKILNAFFNDNNIKNVDLDTIVESGCYLITENSVAHRPSTAGWLILLVFRPYYDSNGSIVVQLATNANNTGFYIRTVGGGPWSAWKQITIS